MTPLALGLTDLAPQIAERVQERDTAARQCSSATPGVGDSFRDVIAKGTAQKRPQDAEFALQEAIKNEKSAPKPQKLHSYVKVGIVAAAGVLVVFGSIVTGLVPKKGPAVIIISSPFLILYIYWWIMGMREDLQDANKRMIPPATIAALLRTVGRTEMEDIYGWAAAEIFDAENTLGTETAQTLLVSLNELLSATKRLDEERHALDAALGGQSLAAIEAEYAALSEKKQSATDAMARQILGESMALCERRLERAQQLVPLQERVEAQLGGITQTMRSVQASVAALRIAPGGADLGALQESARGLVQRTQAIEDAVQEVLRIG